MPRDQNPRLVGDLNRRVIAIHFVLHRDLGSGVRAVAMLDGIYQRFFQGQLDGKMGIISVAALGHLPQHLVGDGLGGLQLAWDDHFLHVPNSIISQRNRPEAWHWQKPGRPPYLYTR